MGKFNWWRREKPKRKLNPKDAFKGKSFLLQQIEHGDFEYSDYRRQALNELDLCKKEQAKLTKEWKAGPESLQYRLDEIQRKYAKRYNKLMEDHHETEMRLLRDLKAALVKEFGTDVWNESVDCCKGDLISLYWEYKKKANEKNTIHNTQGQL
mgnify:CR=1 FL=1